MYSRKAAVSGDSSSTAAAAAAAASGAGFWRRSHSARSSAAASRWRAASLSTAGSADFSSSKATRSLCSASRRRKSSMALLRGDRARGLGLLGQGLVERVPSQAGALDARRILAHAGEGAQLAQAGIRLGFAGDQLMELLEQGLGLGARLALDRVGEQRGGSGRDGAARALELHLPHPVALERHPEREPVAAEAVEALGLAAALAQRTEVARPLAVVEDQLLVQIAELRHQANISLALRRPAASWSRSARVL